jgi:hypothetical protein
MVRVLFPVPWPNDRQKNKRIFSTDFFNLLANRLTSDGGFFMVTDHHGLAQWTMDQALNSEMALTCQESPAILDTKYERKWLTFGQKAFYHLNGKKKNHKSAPQPASDDMTPRFSQLIDPNNYCPHDLTGEPSVVFGDFLYDSSRQVGLLRTKVVEDHFIQEFHIKVSRQPDGRFKVSPALKDQIFPTRGVSLALALAALEEPHP